MVDGGPVGPMTGKKSRSVCRPIVVGRQDHHHEDRVLYTGYIEKSIYKVPMYMGILLT